MSTLIEDIDASAAWMARCLQSSGFRADFSAQSLWSVDRFFDENSRRGRPTRRGLLAADLGTRMFALGAYVGEVIRRDVGGTWRADEGDPTGELNIALVLSGGAMIWPVQRVMKRMANGPEDGIAVYGAALGLEVGQPPQPAGKRRIGRTR